MNRSVPSHRDRQSVFMKMDISQAAVLFCKFEIMKMVVPLFKIQDIGNTVKCTLRIFLKRIILAGFP